jgi:hypothetical protein
MKTIIHGLTLVSLILLTACMAGAAPSPGRWELLGHREVDFKNDHDRIDVGRSEGRFKQIQVRVKNAPIEVSDMFRIIDLPGERRTIKRIDFNYKSINRREGKGTVEVLGR